MPIVWSIGGSDSSAGAGVQQDIKGCAALNVHCCTVVTALTAQNTWTVSNSEAVGNKVFAAQFQALENDFPPVAVKSGMFTTVSQIRRLAVFLHRNPQVRYVCDPVMVATAGAYLSSSRVIKAMMRYLLPKATVVTPNLYEAQALVPEAQTGDKKALAELIIKRYGCRSVVVTGGDGVDNQTVWDFWTDGVGREGLWLGMARYSFQGKHFHGTGCYFSAALAAAWISGGSTRHALIAAKMAVTAAMADVRVSGQFSWLLPVRGKTGNKSALPWLDNELLHLLARAGPFPAMESPPGFYPIIAHADWLPMLGKLGVGVVQLRLKTGAAKVMEAEVARAVSLARQYGIRLFINDYWVWACQYGAYGVHIGYEDLCELTVAQWSYLRKSGLHLGISTHDYYELACARALAPSYIALGPVYHTESKPMRFQPQGLARVREWKTLLGDTPLVAVGGLGYHEMQEVYEAGADGAAVIRYVTEARHVRAAVEAALPLSSQYGHVCTS